MANGRGTLTDTNGIAVVSEDLLDTQAESLKDGVGVLSDDAGVAAHLHLIGRLSDGAINDDDLGIVTGDSLGELGVGGDGGGGTAGTTGGATVLASVTVGNLSARLDTALEDDIPCIIRRLTSVIAARLPMVLVGAARACPDRHAASARKSLKLAIEAGDCSERKVKRG
ncbi:unnamed protein product [Aspergillus oryzae var. brunneus]|uniref:Unnamed protein product n=1 Tax=Aspergillus oryzae var. brunneus TaxID=332754 RepID=A0ABQ6KGH8_ASPOZ|nr:unnamed protein product [Aspergillus oryzae]GMG42839.1 unnamed protein product [Aspergillus oryzae var. brunneus]